MPEFRKGQLVAYCPVDVNGEVYKVEIGVFNKYNKNKTAGFVWYHMGGTCACTPLDWLYPIANDQYLVIGHTFNSLDRGDNQDEQQ